MKGQTDTVEVVFVAIAVGIIVLIGLTVYGVSQDLFPHDLTFNNETLCTTCVNGSGGATVYAFDNLPVVNDSSIVCYNDSRNLMTNGFVDSATCLGYNVFGLANLNITNTSNVNGCQISNVVCTYVQNIADDQRQSFYTTTNSTIFSGFGLAAVVVIVLAAFAVITIVFLIKA